MSDTKLSSEEESAAPHEQKKATPFPVRVSSEEVNHLPRGQYEGDIVLVTSDEAMLEVLPILQGEPILGFDTETRPAFRKGQSYLPSLLQLGAANAVYIFQLQKIKQLDRLFTVLESPKVQKVGVAIEFDIRMLKKIQDFNPQGFLNLEELTDSVGIENNGLRKLTAIVLGFRISKGSQRSNWANEVLTDKQLTYAATDAWVSREMFYRLVDAGATVSTKSDEASS